MIPKEHLKGPMERASREQLPRSYPWPPTPAPAHINERPKERKTPKKNKKNLQTKTRLNVCSTGSQKDFSSMPRYGRPEGNWEGTTGTKG